MTTEIISLSSHEEHPRGELTLHTYRFSDGTRVDEIELSGLTAPILTVTTPDHELVKEPGHDRYPFLEQFIRGAIAHFNETGELPFLPDSIEN